MPTSPADKPMDMPKFLPAPTLIIGIRDNTITPFMAHLIRASFIIPVMLISMADAAASRTAINKNMMIWGGFK